MNRHLVSSSTPEQAPFAYRGLVALSRGIFACTQRSRLHGLDHFVPLRGRGFILAASHLAHLDPVCISTLLPQLYIRWMARIEFYRHRVMARLLHATGCFPINRKGMPISTIRAAIRIVSAGGVVGIFPEGEVMEETTSVLSGASLKRGACLISRYTDCPIVPCVIRGTRRLNSLDPWLPARRGELELALGQPLVPDDTGVTPRNRDERMALRLADAMRTLDRQLPAKLKEQAHG